jgi:hypothetical protein
VSFRVERTSRIGALAARPWPPDLAAAAASPPRRPLLSSRKPVSSRKPAAVESTGGPPRPGISPPEAAPAPSDPAAATPSPVRRRVPGPARFGRASAGRRPSRCRKGRRRGARPWRRRRTRPRRRGLAGAPWCLDRRRIARCRPCLSPALRHGRRRPARASWLARLPAHRDHAPRNPAAPVRAHRPGQRRILYLTAPRCPHADLAASTREMPPELDEGRALAAQAAPGPPLTSGTSGAARRRTGLRSPAARSPPE